MIDRTNEPGEDAALTRVLLAFDRTRHSRRLLFGDPVRSERLDGSSSYAFFEPESVLCYVAWEAGAYGTKRWSLTVCRTAKPGSEVSRIDGIEPGATILLHAKTAHYVRKALAVTDEIVETGTALTDVPDAYWRRVAAAFACRKRHPVFGPDAALAAAVRKAVDG